MRKRTEQRMKKTKLSHTDMKLAQTFNSLPLFVSRSLAIFFFFFASPSRSPLNYFIAIESLQVFHISRLWHKNLHKFAILLGFFLPPFGGEKHLLLLFLLRRFKYLHSYTFRLFFFIQTIDVYFEQKKTNSNHMIRCRPELLLLCVQQC